MVKAARAGASSISRARRPSPASPTRRPIPAPSTALSGLVRSAAIELGPHKITVNNVCPNHGHHGLGAWQNEYFSKVVGAASVDDYLKAMAERIPLKRPGKPEDTAKAVAFLCSDEADTLTAESMNVSRRRGTALMTNTGVPPPEPDPLLSSPDDSGSRLSPGKTP